MIGEEELVYNIKLGRREALESLFFIYEKKMRQVVKKYTYLFDRIGYSKDDIDTLLYNSLVQTLKHYSFSGGDFYSFARVVLTRSIIAVFRNKANSIELNCYNVTANYDEETFSFEESIEDLNENIIEETSYNEIIEYFDVLTDFEMEIMKLLLSGYSYAEISSLYSINSKKVGNTIQRARAKLKKEMNK